VPVAKLTIHHLEVRFQVDGDDHAVFTRLFEKHIRAWSRAHEQECARREQSERDRGYGDRGGAR
jgi:hypothetical protein